MYMKQVSIDLIIFLMWVALAEVEETTVLIVSNRRSDLRDHSGYAGIRVCHAKHLVAKYDLRTGLL